MQPTIWKPQTELRLPARIRNLDRRPYELHWTAVHCGERDESKIHTIFWGYALKNAMRVVAEQQEGELVDVAKEAGAQLVYESSLKAVLDPRLGSTRPER